MAPDETIGASSSTAGEVLVASLSIRKPDEEETRQILKRAALSPERLGDLFLKVFGPDLGVDLELTSREPHEPESFDS
jgi:hypothetical protein